MLVEPLTVGPIVGYTTDTTCRLWGRGPEEDPDLARVFGVARATRAGPAQVVAEARFKMRAKWDYTGVGDVTALSADTAYDYQVGFVRGPADWDEIPAGTPLDWTGASAGVF